MFWYIALIMNNSHGHSINQGVVGGGLVNIKINEREAEFEQLPTSYRTKPLSRASSFSILPTVEKRDEMSK
ncbi:MAG: hypothetical protein FJ368_00160 [Pelagibacterales bacterium]|nr:hypothetical protein [Pelagibacterales bacterium]